MVHGRHAGELGSRAERCATGRRRRVGHRERVQPTTRGAHEPRESDEVNLPVVRATAAERTQAGGLVLLCLASWAIPGVGHLWLGRRWKGVVFLVALPLMFALGLAMQGRLFPLAFSEPLVGLAALANLGIGLTYVVASASGYGAGDALAVTYEYGNAFLIVAGLLNMLVVIDVYDIALGRK